MKYRIIRSMEWMIVLLFIICGGCGTTSTVMKKITQEDEGLKKKVMVLPPVDRSGLTEGKLAEEIASDLKERLKGSSGLLICAPPSDFFVPRAVASPRFGVVYNDPELIHMAWNQGINAMLSLYFPPIEFTKDRAGIWPFRYDARVYKIKMIVNVINPANGCLYLTQMELEEVAYKMEEVADMDREEILVRAVEQVAPDMVKRQAKAVQKSLEKAPWISRIVEIRGDHLVINAGTGAGAFENQIFRVYKQGESIVCNTGRTVDLLGANVGEIKIISVVEDYSLAKPESGGPFHSNQIIMAIP